MADGTLTLSTRPVPKLTVERFVRAAQEVLGLEVFAGQSCLSRPVEEAVFHRPGLALTGFYEHFAYRRPQLFGKAETAYLQTLGEERMPRWEALLSRNIPCALFCDIGDSPLGGDLLRRADAFGIPVLATRQPTRTVITQGSLIMHKLTAPRATVHGTLVDVGGIGVLLEGPSGIGKSETALGLLRRGYALISDDATELTLDAHGALTGSAPEQMRGYMEIRGLGLLNVQTLFGIAAVKPECRLDLIVTLRRCLSEEDVDREGEVRSCEILGHAVQRMVIPVAAGRDFVNVVETAAATYKMRNSGIDAAAQLDAQIIAHNHYAEQNHE